MPTIMCTRRLWNAMGGHGSLPSRTRPARSSSRLGDWSACEVPTTVGYIVVALEESTYLTALCPVAPVSVFPRLLAASVGAVLEALGVPTGVAYEEAAAIANEARFARNDNRSLLGSVNDVAFHAHVRLEADAPGDLEALAQVQRELNDMPHVRRQPALPSDAVRLLLQPGRVVH